MKAHLAILEDLARNKANCRVIMRAEREALEAAIVCPDLESRLRPAGVRQRRSGLRACGWRAAGTSSQVGGEAVTFNEAAAANKTHDVRRQAWTHPQESQRRRWDGLRNDCQRGCWSIMRFLAEDFTATDWEIVL